MSALAISSVQIGERHRRDLGDINRLAASIDEIGLLHPIVVTPDNVLIAGARRLEACRALGWSKIPVTVVSLEGIVRGEFAENAIRKDFLPTEIHAIRRATLPVEKAAAKKRMSEGGKGWKVSGPSETRDRIGAFAGVSGRTVEKIAAVVEAAEEEPDKFMELVEEMDRTGKVDSAYRKLMQAKDEQRILSMKPVVGRYRTLVIDPPWDHEGFSLAGRGRPEYAVMSLEQLLELPVASWAEDDCHLYLWSTNNFVIRAVELIQGWGFDYKTMLTWVKPRIGLGSYFRSSTEHCLFAVRGTMTTRATDIGTLFKAPIGEHSVKPDVFYEIVRRASYPPYGEAFQREERADFSNLFGAREAA